jgi:hypothetical protein
MNLFGYNDNQKNQKASSKNDKSINVQSMYFQVTLHNLHHVSSYIGIKYYIYEK